MVGEGTQAPWWRWAAWRRRRGRAGCAEEAAPAALPRPGQGRLGAVSGLWACGRGTAGPCLSRSAPRGNYRGARRCGRAPRGTARWLEAFKLKAALGRGGGRGAPSKGRGQPGTATPLSAPAEGRSLAVSAAPPPRSPAGLFPRRPAGRGPRPFSTWVSASPPLASTRTLPPGGPPRLTSTDSLGVPESQRVRRSGLSPLLGSVTLIKFPPFSGPQCPLQKYRYFTLSAYLS